MLVRRGHILREPNTGDGVISIDGQQYSFSLPQWKSDIAPAINMAVDCEFDDSGKLVSVQKVSYDQMAKDQADRIVKIGRNISALFFRRVDPYLDKVASHIDKNATRSDGVGKSYKTIQSIISVISPQRRKKVALVISALVLFSVVTTLFLYFDNSKPGHREAIRQVKEYIIDNYIHNDDFLERINSPIKDTIIAKWGDFQYENGVQDGTNTVGYTVTVSAKVKIRMPYSEYKGIMLNLCISSPENNGYNAQDLDFNEDIKYMHVYEYCRDNGRDAYPSVYSDSDKSSVYTFRQDFYFVKTEKGWKLQGTVGSPELVPTDSSDQTSWGNVAVHAIVAAEERKYKESKELFDNYSQEMSNLDNRLGQMAAYQHQKVPTLSFAPALYESVLTNRYVTYPSIYSSEEDILNNDKKYAQKLIANHASLVAAYNRAKEMEDDFQSCDGTMSDRNFHEWEIRGAFKSHLSELTVKNIQSFLKDLTDSDKNIPMSCNGRKHNVSFLETLNPPTIPASCLTDLIEQRKRGPLNNLPACLHMEMSN